MNTKEHQAQEYAEKKMCAPPELSKAIGSLREAEQYLKKTNAKMNVK